MAKQTTHTTRTAGRTRRAPHIVTPAPAYCDALLELATKLDDLIVLSPGSATQTGIKPFEKKHPAQFIQCGETENIIHVAIGLAIKGKRPVAILPATQLLAGITDLLTAQHKNLNITILGTHAGLSKKPALTDIAVARIASLTILAPDTNRIKNAVIAGGLNPTPTYIRIHDGKPTDEEPFTIGKAYTLKDGTDCTLLCTGNTPTHALRAAELLSAEDLDCGVIHSPSIIPLDTDTITTAVRTSGCLVTIEEHNAATGFGSAVTNITSKYAPTPTRQVGADKTPLSPERIAEAAREAILQRCQAACVDLPQLMGDTQALQTPYEFHLYGGTSIHTLPGLQKALLTMSDSQFSHHCNAHKNDFSNWVAHAFNPRLGKQLANKRSRLAMATTLTRWLA